MFFCPAEYKNKSMIFFKFFFIYIYIVAIYFYHFKDFGCFKVPSAPVIFFFLLYSPLRVH